MAAGGAVSSEPGAGACALGCVRLNEPRKLQPRYGEVLKRNQLSHSSRGQPGLLWQGHSAMEMFLGACGPASLCVLQGLVLPGSPQGERSRLGAEGASQGSAQHHPVPGQRPHIYGLNPKPCIAFGLRSRARGTRCGGETPGCCWGADGTAWRSNLGFW